MKLIKNSAQQQKQRIELHFIVCLWFYVHRGMSEKFEWRPKLDFSLEKPIPKPQCQTRVSAHGLKGNVHQQNQQILV